MDIELYLSSFKKAIGQMIETAEKVDNDEKTIKLNKDLRNVAVVQVACSIKGYWEIYLTTAVQTMINEISDYIKEIDVDHLKTSVLNELIHECCCLVDYINSYISTEF